jgi:hypothetical protein
VPEVETGGKMEFFIKREFAQTPGIFLKDAIA